jgi:hypothetical protein
LVRRFVKGQRSASGRTGQNDNGDNNDNSDNSNVLQI